MPLPTGPITLVSQKDGFLLTALDDTDGAPVAMLPPGDADSQKWLVDTAGDAFVIRTAQADALFLVAASEDFMSPLILSRIPRNGPWNDVDSGPGIVLRLSDAPFLAGNSLLRIWPPRVALMSPDTGNEIVWRPVPAA
jgi:hypothetical protein